jgi:putative colanic acid biosynthesis UDP-glucose lipid carrier transferase
LAFITKTGAVYSRLWLGAWILLAWGVLLVFHAALRGFLRWVREKGFNSRRIVIVGAGQLGRNVARHIQEVPWTGFKAVAFYDDNPNLHGQVIDGVKVKGAPSRLARLLKKHYIDEVWLALPLRAEQRVKEILAELRHSTVNVRFVPDIFGFRLLNHGVSEVAGIPVLDLNRTPMVGINRIVKAFEDRLLASIILLLASPLMLFVALAIKLTSHGPVLFKQLRHGWDGKPIVIYKFRTMRLHQEPKGCVTQACRNDLRVTKLGAFLRHTSLDELPQFINVLQGRMSIVGPRPHAMEHTDQYKDLVEAYMQRHKVKPGITGWAQINGWRGETDTVEKMKRRVEYDLYYIENWSIWFDLKIIILTFFKGMVHANAY